MSEGVRSITIRSPLVFIIASLGTVLAVTGVALTFLYEPNTNDAASVSIRVLRHAHSLASLGLVVTAVVATVRIVMAAWKDQRWVGVSTRAVAGVLAVVLVVATSVTGSALAWDQVALYSITAESISGVLRPAFDDEVVFLLIGGGEVSTSAYRTVVVLHLVGLPLALATAAWWARRQSERRAAGGPALVSDAPSDQG